MALYRKYGGRFCRGRPGRRGRHLHIIGQLAWLEKHRQKLTWRYGSFETRPTDRVAQIIWRLRQRRWIEGFLPQYVERGLVELDPGVGKGIKSFRWNFYHQLGWDFLGSSIYNWRRR